MCCKCHWPNTCLNCNQQLGWHHRWHCPQEGAVVTKEQCCELCDPEGIAAATLDRMLGDESH